MTKEELSSDVGQVVVWNVDTEKDFMYSTGALSVPGAESIISALKKIFDTARQHSIRILGSADGHNKKSTEFTENGGPFPKHCEEGTDGQLNIPETLLEPKQVGIVRWNESYSARELSGRFSKRQVILTKDSYDVFTSPHITALLKTIQPGTTIYVMGVATEYCVKAAVLGLIKWAKTNNCKVVVITDAIKGITSDGERQALAEMREAGAHFATTEEVVKALELHSEKRGPGVTVPRDRSHESRITGEGKPTGRTKIGAR